MESVAAIPELNEIGVRYAWTTRPLAFDPPVNLTTSTDPARKLDPATVIRRAEAAFVRDDVALMKSVHNLSVENLSIASLYQLQARAALATVKHEVAAGVVSNLSQSIKTVLNAA
ncbi:hypothetical protein [Burkholderia pyrrocinia]